MPATHRPITPSGHPLALPTARNLHQPTLQAYVRYLHETRNQHGSSDEPVRRKDPWNGIGL